MRRIYYLPIAVFAFATFSCKDKTNTEKTEEVKNFDIANLDTTAILGNDFYQYATGGWAKANPIKDEYARYGSFDQLAEKNQEQVKEIIEDLGKTTHKEGSIEQKIGDLFAMGMDSVTLNSEGAKPIASELDAIKSATNVADIIRLAGEIRRYANSPFFGLYVGADDKNSSMNLVQLYQGGLGLGERDYYVAQDSTSIALRKGYQNLIKVQFVNAGYSEAEGIKAADAVLKIETALAQDHFKKEDTRKPELNYHKMKVEDLNKSVGNFDWTAFFDAAGAKGFTELNVSQVKPITTAVKLIQTLPLDESKAYLSWCVINSAASYLSDEFVDANFDFYGKQLTGRKVLQPRWKRTVRTVDGALSEAVGQMYVAKYFPAEAKDRMIKLVKNLQETLGERINNLSWMSDVTKEKAQEKLNAFTVKIGYPDKWKDYSTLEIKKDSYWANIVRASEFDYTEMINKIGKPVDKSEWHMPPQMVNAYYNPTTNEICFPAGILQPPFFYLDADDAVNYGAIGVVIGHEMSHGFDDQGSQYDKDGNLANWWTADDSKKFTERAQVLVQHFNKIEVLPNVFANGEFTLGENIGDFGGLQIAYNAFEKTEQAKTGDQIDGFTPAQRFFLSYAGVWAGNIRDEEVLRLTKIDPHSLGKWRVNGTLPHINAWYEAFNITEKDSLFIPKEKRADIW
ncbi:M13 family metallopeptidase [Dysgonomonas sp. Marseille-P4677]|uniref:M13 family metallopeptidase n=1 Tax=Dysgonomonas sp. Marseille-P4677 TaxID=2364790 RepID=UPI0019117860|nr:M13 family metallopeptidase [Dysgonomonas sp. Marseille-P4677]MBK5720250.1 M13 family metallopeptidase [Dysgonomonas sp. Marseille-P4677]